VSLLNVQRRPDGFFSLFGRTKTPLIFSLAAAPPFLLFVKVVVHLSGAGRSRLLPPAVTQYRSTSSLFPPRKIGVEPHPFGRSRCWCASSTSSNPPPPPLSGGCERRRVFLSSWIRVRGVPPSLGLTQLARFGFFFLCLCASATRYFFFFFCAGERGRASFLSWPPRKCTL